MRIAELFCSIQGEGMLVGVPSVFVRTSGCNLRCRWCDTPFASWELEGEDLPVAAVVDYVNERSTGYVVITGGEPMIWPEVVPLTGQLRRMGQHITVETAGTVFEPVACDLMSISPKLAHSTPDEPEKWAIQHERLRIQPDVLARLMRDYSYQLKFVVMQPADLDEIRDLLERTGARRDRVVLMAEGTDAATLRERGRWLVEICKREGYRYSPRLHIELYGNRRGV